MRLFTSLGAAVIVFFSFSVASLEEEALSQMKTCRLKILTSFSPEFYTPFIEYFQTKNPAIQIQILNKKTTAAIAEIQRGNSREFDIFWSSSPDAFAVLKENRNLRHTAYFSSYSPLNKKKSLSGDPDGYFFNFAVSGVGYMWNKDILDEKGISIPFDWVDLCDSRFYGHLAMSTPSRSGTNHLIVESLLQGMGWENGWQFLLKLSGNLKTITARSFSVPDGVANGRFGSGLVIDFLALSKMHHQKEIGFSYGKPVFLIPASIAVPINGKHMEEAVAFIDFLLSKEGQKLLLDPSIGRLPVSDALLSTEKKQYHPLMKLILSGSTRTYDTELSKSRYSLVNNLFDQLITYHLLERRQIWKRLLRLEKNYGIERVQSTGLKQKVLDLLCQIPVTEKQSLEKTLNKVFRASAAQSYGEQRRKILQEWEDFVTQRLEQAEKLITEVDMQLAGTRDRF